MNMKLGDSVIVKQGVKEPDFEEFSIGGWQGRVVEIDTKSDKDNNLIMIEWDSLTLRQIPSKYIEQSERDGLDWKNMTLYESELEKSKPRDTKENVKQTQDKLSDNHYWDSLGDEVIRISKILDNGNYSACKVAIVLKASKTFCPFLMQVSVTDRMTAKICAPFSVLKWPDIFCFTFTFLMALSELLLSGKTS